MALRAVFTVTETAPEIDPDARVFSAFIGDFRDTRVKTQCGFRFVHGPNNLPRRRVANH